ncbi:Protein CBR-ZIP-12 [Caenorhabditis briggsae]|uniref:Protein CBR-ZIP-12 n=3 Tax=Caenorhabditis briggsae TaxID=6238 RepID=A8XDZ7_CAEBR|nr:Protein CBR-ZIP-12 [Caenorhabditis briggsae]CAP30803.2 Protein CBR-ZIP-12 [Caenorhabditis briggsae]
MADGSEVFQFLLDTLNGQINNNETSSGIPEFSGTNNQNLEEQEIPEILKVIMDFQKNSVPEDVVPEDVESENPIFNLLNQGIQNNEKDPEILEKLNRFFSISSIDQVDHDQNFEKNNEIDMDDTTEEWREEYRKLNQNETKFDKKDEERRRQMAKNREYARKCVQKKKDMRKQAEVRSVQIQRRIQLQQKITAIKEKNANFAVDLRKMTGETQILEEQKTYEQSKQAMNQKFDSLFAVDETVNLNFHRFASAREEFEKAATDLRIKNGVIGTLGSRKIRAKQQMEWRQHLYDISVNEHKLRRETKLSELADNYVKNTVPKAAPLIQSIPKDVLDQLIENNRAADLEEFYRFVVDNSTDSAPHFFVDNSDKVVK